MLQPSRTKYRKQFRGRMRGKSQGHLVTFGDWGLKADECGWITANQIEAARRAITHYTKRNGRLWIRIFPDKPVKGYVSVIRPGRILFEVGGVNEHDSHEALKLAAAKLPINTKIVKRK